MRRLRRTGLVTAGVLLLPFLCRADAVDVDADSVRGEALRGMWMVDY